MIVLRNKEFSLFNLFNKKTSEPPIEIKKKLEPFEMEIEDVFSVTGRGAVVTGKIKKGYIEVGDEVQLNGSLFSGTVVVKQIDKFRKIIDKAVKGENVGLNLKDIDYKKIKRGDTLCNL